MSEADVSEPPAEQVALRAAVEAVLTDYSDRVSYEHDDHPWDPEARPSVYGWGTTITPHAGEAVVVWFDGLDLDIALFQGGSRWGRQGRRKWCEWQDLTDLNGVLGGVERELRAILGGLPHDRPSA